MYLVLRITFGLLIIKYPMELRQDKIVIGKERSVEIKILFFKLMKMSLLSKIKTYTWSFK